MDCLSLSSLLCVISCMLWTGVSSRHAHSGCNGHARGDKWFDGCKWCVCESSGPLCSPGDCSDLVTKLHPCLNIGSRWKDGCYHCKCSRKGIQCTADSTCLQLMQVDEYALSPSACVTPEDDRCVCGIDGVPSCSAEVIDRNAYPATTVSIDGAKRHSNIFDKNEDNSFISPARSTNLDWVYGLKRKKRSVHSRREKLSSLLRRYGGRSDDMKPHRSHSHRSANHNYRGFNSIPPSKGYHSLPSVKNIVDEYRFNRMNDATSDVGSPGSLLLITDNRCRFGQRWYGGSLRCYCHEDGAITCGDPEFVATKIDGYQLHRKRCEEDHEWIEEEACQVCTCKISGVVLCRRADFCPLPFLIKPIRMIHKRTNGQESITNRIRNEIDQVRSENSPSKSYSRHTQLKSHPRHPVDLPSHNSINKGNDVVNFPVTHNRVNESKLRQFLTEQGLSKTEEKLEKELFNECQPGSRWIENGCKRCTCGLFGRKSCNDAYCPKPYVHQLKPPGLIYPAANELKMDRPFQRPPHVTRIRYKPIAVKPLFPTAQPCGPNIKIGAIYWSKCNRCVCYPYGPKCTAVSCRY